MGRFFPKLTQTKVFIQTDDAGNGFECDMLPVSAMNDIDILSTDLAEAVKDAQYVQETVPERPEIKNASEMRLKRIYDRVQEMCVPVKFEGQSRRQAEYAKKIDRMKALLNEE